VDDPRPAAARSGRPAGRPVPAARAGAAGPAARPLPDPATAAPAQLTAQEGKGGRSGKTLSAVLTIRR